VRHTVATDRAPAPTGAFSQAVEQDGWIFVTGQIPLEPESGTTPSGIRAQTFQALTNVAAILAAAGLGRGDIVQARIFLANLDDFAEFNAAYSEFFDPPYPARTTIGCALLGVLVEIDVVARRPLQRSAGEAR
jgi:reactive intermediate/imine deaminase